MQWSSNYIQKNVTLPLLFFIVTVTEGSVKIR